MTTEVRRAALKLAIQHIKHMAAWIGLDNRGYSFEGLGEDLPGIEDALASYDREYLLTKERASDPNVQYDGTLDSLARCATMLETWGPECMPVNDRGRVHFARAMLDCTAGEIRAYLAAQGLDLGTLQKFAQGEVSA